MKMISFGSWSFPQAKGEWSFPLASLRGGRPVMAAAGVWDDLGDLVVLRPGLVQAKFVISSDASWSDVDADLDDAKEALFTERALLGVATGTSGTASRQALARCVSLDVPFKYDKPRLALCTAKFELLQPHWDGVPGPIYTSRSGTAFNMDNSESTCQTQRTLILRVDGPMTILWTLTNTTNGMTFTYDGATHPIPMGQKLSVDCGALTVIQHTSTDVWNYFSIGANQIGFMALEPGINSFTQSISFPVVFERWYSYL